MWENVIVLVLNLQREAFDSRYTSVSFFFCFPLGWVCWFVFGFLFYKMFEKQIYLEFEVWLCMYCFLNLFILILMRNAFLPILVGWFPQSCVKSHWQNKIPHMTFIYWLRCQLKENNWSIDFGFINAVNKYPITGAVLFFPSFFFSNEYEQLVI